MVGSTVRVTGALERSALETTLQALVREHQIVRLKGRAWLPGKALPLQIQMVGPRLNSWFEAAPVNVWRPSDACGVDLVVLALMDSAETSVRDAVQRLVQATPATASTAASTPES